MVHVSIVRDLTEKKEKRYFFNVYRGSYGPRPCNKNSRYFKTPQDALEIVLHDYPEVKEIKILL